MASDSNVLRPCSLDERCRQDHNKEHRRCDDCQENEAEDGECIHRKVKTQLKM